MNYVIVGASGHIGSALYRRLSSDHQVIGTYCYCPVERALRYNMLFDDPGQLPIDWHSIDSVVIAVGDSRIEECATNVRSTRQLNVEAFKKFCDFAASKRLHVTFLSSDYVYDGTPNDDGSPRMHTEDEALAPTTQYGMQKVEAERYLTDCTSDHLIVRLTMNVGVTRRLGFPLASWADALHRGESLRLATDLVHCLTWVHDTVGALKIALCSRAVGTFNLASSTFHSRYEWGKRVCYAIGADPDLVAPCTVKDLEFSEPRPLDLSLNTSKFHNSFEFNFTPIDELMGLLSRLYS